MATHQDREYRLITQSYGTASATEPEALLEAWRAVESLQNRLASEWAEANRYFVQQFAAIQSRAREQAEREQRISQQQGALDAQEAGFQEEARSLETRVQHARAALAKLERRRELLRSESFATVAPTHGGLVAGFPEDFAHQERQMVQETAAVARLRDQLHEQSADVDDARRQLAEQFRMMAQARNHWQQSERQTLGEMETLARALCQREAELDSREQRLIRADSLRCEEADLLWRERMRLEVWQTHLSIDQSRWQAERQQREAELEQQQAVAACRELELQTLLQEWADTHAVELNHLQTEREFWQLDRARFQITTAEFAAAQQQGLHELQRYAARVLATEELVATALQDSGSTLPARRLAVLRQRWERIFEHKTQELVQRLAEQTSARVLLDERYGELKQVLTEIADREAALHQREAEHDRKQWVTPVATVRFASVPPLSSPELVVLRDEVERLACLVLELEPPAPPEQELPWAIVEKHRPQGGRESRAA